MKDRQPEYPYDFRLMSYSKCKELGLEFDIHAGAGTELGRHNYIYAASLEKFGSVDAFKKHVIALMEYFLDFSVADTWEEAEEYAKTFPPELKVDPIWK